MLFYSVHCLLYVLGGKHWRPTVPQKCLVADLYHHIRPWVRGFHINCPAHRAPSPLPNRSLKKSKDDSGAEAAASDDEYGAHGEALAFLRPVHMHCRAPPPPSPVYGAIVQNQLDSNNDGEIVTRKNALRMEMMTKSES